MILIHKAKLKLLMLSTPSRRFRIACSIIRTGRNRTVALFCPVVALKPPQKTHRHSNLAMRTQAPLSKTNTSCATNYLARGNNASPTWRHFYLFLGSTVLLAASSATSAAILQPAPMKLAPPETRHSPTQTKQRCATLHHALPRGRGRTFIIQKPSLCASSSSYEPAFRGEGEGRCPRYEKHV